MQQPQEHQSLQQRLAAIEAKLNLEGFKKIIGVAKNGNIELAYVVKLQDISDLKKEVEVLRREHQILDHDGRLAEKQAQLENANQELEAMRRRDARLAVITPEKVQAITQVYVQWYNSVRKVIGTLNKLANFIVNDMENANGAQLNQKITKLQTIKSKLSKLLISPNFYQAQTEVSSQLNGLMVLADEAFVSLYAKQLSIPPFSIGSLIKLADSVVEVIGPIPEAERTSNQQALYEELTKPAKLESIIKDISYENAEPLQPGKRDQIQAKLEKLNAAQTSITNIITAIDARLPDINSEFSAEDLEAAKRERLETEKNNITQLKIFLFGVSKHIDHKFTRVMANPDYRSQITNNEVFLTHAQIQALQKVAQTTLVPAIAAELNKVVDEAQKNELTEIQKAYNEISKLLNEINKKYSDQGDLTLSKDDAGKQVNDWINQAVGKIAGLEALIADYTNKQVELVELNAMSAMLAATKNDLLNKLDGLPLNEQLAATLAISTVNAPVAGNVTSKNREYIEDLTYRIEHSQDYKVEKKNGQYVAEITKENAAEVVNDLVALQVAEGKPLQKVSINFNRGDHSSATNKKYKAFLEACFANGVTPQQVEPIRDSNSAAVKRLKMLLELYEQNTDNKDGNASSAERFTKLLIVIQRDISPNKHGINLEKLFRDAILLMAPSELKKVVGLLADRGYADKAVSDDDKKEAKNALKEIAKLLADEKLSVKHKEICFAVLNNHPKLSDIYSDNDLNAKQAATLVRDAFLACESNEERVDLYRAIGTEIEQAGVYFEEEAASFMGRLFQSKQSQLFVENLKQFIAPAPVPGEADFREDEGVMGDNNAAMEPLGEVASDDNSDDEDYNSDAEQIPLKRG